MNSAAREFPIFSVPRWLVLLAFIFLTQVLLIYFLSARKHAVIPQTPLRVVPLQIFSERVTESQFSEKFLVSDPALFASANSHGFSGAAWLKTPARDYEQFNLARHSEPSFWLPLNVEQLGDGIGQYIRANTIATVPVSKHSAPKIALTQTLDLSNPKTNSQFRIEGDLSSREIIDPPQLQAWAHTELLSNSIAQVAVDQRGIVLSARLLSRSGYARADINALEVARNLQFIPSNKSAITWGQVIFDWQTVPVILTNSTNEILQSK